MCQAYDAEFNFVCWLERKRDEEIQGKCVCGCWSFHHNPAFPGYPCQEHWGTCRAFRPEYVSTVGDVA